MSEENVEIVRAAIEAFNQRDGAAFDALLASEAKIIPVRAAVESVTYEGADAGSQYCAAVDERWENARWEVEDIRADDDWVLALGHIRGRGRDSGAAIDARGGWVAHLHEGLITGFHTFSDRAAALKAVGLEEQAVSAKSTTPDPVEQVRRSTEAANRGELDAAIGYYARDAVWDTSRNAFGTFEGAATIRRFWDEWFSAYEELRLGFEELLDLGNGVVFAVIRQEARPVGTTGYVGQREGWTSVWVDGLCVRVTVYPEADIAEGRAAAERLAKERG